MKNKTPKQANSIQNSFVQAIGGKAKGYRAFMRLPDGRVGITASYTLPFLNEFVIPEAQALGHKLIKVEPTPE